MEEVLSAVQPYSGPGPWAKAGVCEGQEWPALTQGTRLPEGLLFQQPTHHREKQQQSPGTGAQCGLAASPNSSRGRCRRPVPSPGQAVAVSPSQLPGPSTASSFSAHGFEPHGMPQGGSPSPLLPCCSTGPARSASGRHSRPRGPAASPWWWSHLMGGRCRGGRVSRGSGQDRGAAALHGSCGGPAHHGWPGRGHPSRGTESQAPARAPGYQSIVPQWALLSFAFLITKVIFTRVF